MKKACPYCNKFHDMDFLCPKRPLRYKSNSAIVKFRNSVQWRRKRELIRMRDRNMCRLCAIGYGNKPVEYVSEVSVHHIVPLAADYSLRLDDDNLISLCRYHHELAENGKIPAELLKKLAKSEVSSELC